MKWSDTILKKLQDEIRNDKSWSKVYGQLKASHQNIGIHLAVFNEPFLTLLLEGKKTVESRFSIKKIIPHKSIYKGDIVILKKSGGDIVGFFQVGEVIYSGELDESKFNELKSRYSSEICSNVDPNFWETRVNTRYATLVKVSKTKKINPFHIEKKDRRGWVNISKIYI